jgi:hypothetical protein
MSAGLLLVLDLIFLSRATKLLRFLATEIFAILLLLCFVHSTVDYLYMQIFSSSPSRFQFFTLNNEM